MSASGPNLWLTPDEVIAVLARLDGRSHTVTYKRLRYWDEQGIIPAGRAGDSVNATRLYGVDDVAMVRLALQLLQGGRSLRQVSETLRYRGAHIRRAFHSTERTLLTFNTRGVAEVTTARGLREASDVISLRACVQGVSDAMRQQREKQPTVWSGFRYESPVNLEVALTM